MDFIQRLTRSRLRRPVSRRRIAGGQSIDPANDSRPGATILQTSHPIGERIGFTDRDHADV
jgi:hypothetical protein